VRFHLIDRIDSWSAWEAVAGVKLTSPADAIWRTGPGSEPYMAPALVLESLCQAGTWLLVLSSEQQQRATLASIGAVRFSGRVRPGDVLSLEGRIDSRADDAVMFSGEARVAGRVVMVASEILCALFPAEKLQDPDSTALLARVLERSQP
jgi:3-hydroxyacyl-[acyl-carrier-protein] dehydratase